MTDEQHESMRATIFALQTEVERLRKLALPGLSMHCGDDGVWLTFEGGGVSSTIQPGQFSNAHPGSIIWAGIAHWCNERMAERKPA